ncbi:MAG TPA: flagellar motor protein MotB [Stellaceae bacterium]|nr:flagellar motor protein MotB [Stellaceae bacterium]
MAKPSQIPVIIKKVKGRAAHPHHGGAWKVAYADFVTAMMAFFLLLWLLNVTTDVQKRGIADYFEPTVASKSQSGAGGVLGGQTIGQPGAEAIATSLPSIAINRPALRQPSEGDDGDNGGTPGHDDAGDAGQQTKDNADAAGQPAKRLTDKDLDNNVAAREEKRFAAAAFTLRQAVQQLPELKGLADNLMVDETPEGLRIQLVDQDKQPMFALGSYDLLDPAKKLLAMISQVVARLPNPVTVTGHTDAIPYPGGGRYTNWELSADRANSSRRELVRDGVATSRFARVIGVADRDPLLPDQPNAARNRRITIVLLREAKQPPTQAQAAQASPAAGAGAGAASGSGSVPLERMP